MKNRFLFLNITKFIPVLFLLIMCFFGCGNKTPEFSIVTDPASGAAVSHGIMKLTDALLEKNISFENVGSMNDAQGKSIIVAGQAHGEGEAAQILKGASRTLPYTPEALDIWKTEKNNKSVWVISGSDDTGLMYGLLDVAERIGWSAGPKSPMSEVTEITEQPDVSERAVSLYTMNRRYWESRFYDETYWARYLDMLAQNRFNSMVVIFGYENGGFLAPCYPYFFDTEGFPDVTMVGITPQEQKRNLDALNRLIQMAHDRGIRFTVGIWDHIYRGGVQGGGAAGADVVSDKPVHGLVWGVNSDNLTSYNKTALAKFVKLVPDLDAIQFRMHNESGLKRNEQVGFWQDVFKMIKEVSPDLSLDLRAKELPEAVVQSALDVGVKFRITTKYWMEQMGLPFHTTQRNPERSTLRHTYGDILRYPQQYKMHWRLWTGGTSRILLWGDPGYVRRFAESAHLYNGDSYEVNEPLATKMEAQPHDAEPFELLNPQYQYYDYEFERYWHFFQVFGRIGYNPETSPDVWQKEFEMRFGKDAAPFIEEALHKASWILPRIVASTQPYSKFPTTRGWVEKQRLGDLPDYANAPGSDLRQFANFDEEAQILIEGGETAKILPSMTSRWFEHTSSEINDLILKAENAIGSNRSKEFDSTITDLKILSNLAMYHSRRIPAAVNYRLFERTGDLWVLDRALAHEYNAIEAWRQIVASAGDVYAEDLMMGVREAEYMNMIHRQSGHWKDELNYLEEGIAALEQMKSEFKPNDATGSAPKYKTVADSNNNKLFNIIHEHVTAAQIGEPITINVNVRAESGVKWVRLLYRSVNQDMEYQTLPMLPSRENDSYRAVVPVDKINPKWDFMYLIEIMDKNGKGIIYPDLNKETPYVIVKLKR
jgi:hypothetical protein